MTKEFSDARSLDRVAIIARYAGGSHYDNGRWNGSAFERDLKDTDGVSYVQRGVLAGELEADRAEIRRLTGERKHLGATGCFLELVVGAALDVLPEYHHDLTVVEDPLEADAGKGWNANPAHVLMIGLPFIGSEIGGLLSSLAGDRLTKLICGQFPAKVPVV